MSNLFLYQFLIWLSFDRSYTYTQIGISLNGKVSHNSFETCCIYISYVYFYAYI